MSPIMLHNDSGSSATSVSNNFIDYYMTSANGEYVKVYLYLLRCMSSGKDDFSLSTVADRFEHTEKDIQRALNYWEKMNLLRLEYDQEKKLAGIHMLESKAPVVQEQKREEPQVQQAKKVAAEPKSGYTAAQIKAFREKEEVRELLFVTEHYLKRPLTPTDINTILLWYDELGFSISLIEYLIENCLSKGKASLHYMNKVALGWKESGITTVEQAKRVSSSFSQLHYAVMRALGISNRNLVAPEVAYIDKWSKTYGFTQDIILEACSRTISATHQPSFEYTDGILTNWNKQGVRHLNDIIKLDSERQNQKTVPVQNKATSTNRFNNFSQRTYDYDALEAQLLGKNK